MTLVAAVSGHEGIVLFADTDEIVHGYSKRMIDKLAVWDAADRPFRFAIAGACTDGTYADALQTELEGALFSVGIFDPKKITSALSDSLASFYGKHVWPRVSVDKPQMEYLVAIQPLPRGFPEVVHISETAVNVMGVTAHWKSIGVGSYLADFLFNLMLGGGEPVAQLAAAAVYAAKEVRTNIDGVGEVKRIVVFGSDGTYDELASEDIRTIETNLATLNGAIGELFSIATGVARTPDTESESVLIEILDEINHKQNRWHVEWMQREKQRKYMLEVYAKRLAMKNQSPS